MIREVHIVPLNDTNTHNCRGVNCCCGPIRDLDDSKVIHHFPFDGRTDENKKCPLKIWKTFVIEE